MVTGGVYVKRRASPGEAKRHYIPFPLSEKHLHLVDSLRQYFISD